MPLPPVFRERVQVTQLLSSFYSSMAPALVAGNIQNLAGVSHDVLVVGTAVVSAIVAPVVARISTQNREHGSFWRELVPPAFVGSAVASATMLVAEHTHLFTQNPGTDQTDAVQWLAIVLATGAGWVTAKLTPEP